jgi:hypothetical protein
MKVDPIRQLLQDADASHEPERAINTTALAESVLQTHRRKRRRNTVGQGAVVLLVGSAAVLTLHSLKSAQPQQTLVPVSSTPVPDVKAEIASTEAKLQQLLGAERLAQAQARLEQLAQAPTPNDIAERAAGAVVAQADRLIKSAGLIEPAQRAYHEVIARFPDTPSADVARQRIAELGKEG